MVSLSRISLRQGLGFTPVILATQEDQGSKPVPISKKTHHKKGASRVAQAVRVPA
jgi:hypothetical protein